MSISDEQTTLERIFLLRKSFILPTGSNKELKSEPSFALTIEEGSGNIWEELCRQFDEKRQLIEDYKKSREPDCEQYKNPAVEYLDEVIFPTLNPGMIKMLEKAVEEDCLKRPRTTFDGIDFLSEYLWNMNPQHPERKDNWTNIFDLDWVKKHLKEKPRRYFPFHRIWNRDYAALKIQSYMRGYWVRRREDVQEVRQFWKVIDAPKNF